MSLELWKKYLRFDPTRWLFETDDPSILLWYQLEIANRPEDAPGVVAMRERVVYSAPVQQIFGVQDELGFWGDAESLARPHYTATLWNLALLAELGIPRTSRRARNACEFVLQNHLAGEGAFAGLSALESSYLLRALGYFVRPDDTRLVRCARALHDRLDTPEARLAALWGWRAWNADPEVHAAAQENVEQILDIWDVRHNVPPVTVPYTFPQFDPRDPLFFLRVLAEYGRVGDARAARYVETLVAKQNAQAQWTLERVPDGSLPAQLDRTGEPSRWLTLNALRVLFKLIQHNQ